MDNFLKNIYLGNSVRDWLIAIGIIALATIVIRLLKRIVLSRIRKMAAKTKSSIDDFIVIQLQTAIMPLLYIFCLYLGLKYLILPASAERVIHVAMLAATIFFVIKTIASIFAYILQQYASKGNPEQSQVKQTRGILLIIKIVLWVIGFTFLVDNLGYNITTIITGLGIGGIAIALAAQAVLGDLFSYFVIFFDKPFDTGDYIVIGDKSGTVEYIGIKTTRLRTLSGEQLILSNTDLTNSRVQNFKRMEKRRVLFAIGVTYETDAKTLRKIPWLIRNIIEPMENVTFDRAHFSRFEDSSLCFEIVYYINSADYTEYMNVHQEVCLNIFQTFETKNIEFAYPTQKLFLQNNNGHSTIRPD